MSTSAARQRGRPEAGPGSSRQRALRLWLTLLVTSRQIEKVVRARLRRSFDRTLPQFDVLAALERFPEGLSMSELSRWLLVSNGNVTGIVQRLEADGLVERDRPGHDRRAYIIRLTAPGRAVFSSMAAAHSGWLDEMLGGLDEDEVDAMQAALDRIRQRPPARPAQE